MFESYAADRHNDTLSHTAESVALQLSAATDRDQRNANSSGGPSDLASSEKLGVVDEEFGPTDGESKHSDMLTNLKQEIGKDNEFTTKVVRMEVRSLTDSQRRH